MDINNYYWGCGFTDGEYNFRPDVDGKRYTPEQIDKYFAGYRCGVRTQKKGGPRSFDLDDRKLRS